MLLKVKLQQFNYKNASNISKIVPQNTKNKCEKYTLWTFLRIQEIGIFGLYLGIDAATMWEVGAPR